MFKIETTFYQLFLFLVEVYRDWNFVCWINIGMIMDNSFIISWLSSLNFQVTINNKARFTNFLINMLNVQVSIIASKSKLPNFFVFFFCFSFFQGVSLSFQNAQSNNTLGIEFFSKKILEVYIYTFCFDRVKFSASSLTFKDKNSDAF